MRMTRRLLSVILLLSLVFSLLPTLSALGAETEQDSLTTDAALSETKPATKAANLSSISVPAYSGGTASTWMTMDGGDSVSFHDGENRSKMQIIKGTTATQYTTYCTKLTNAGYTKVWSRTLAAQSGSNRYAKFLSADKSYSVYTYFVPYNSQTRIIVDTHVDTVEGFSYGGKGSGRTEVYLYGLTYPDNGYAYTATDLGIQRRFPNGSMFVIKMPDNSLFIIDGGNKLQMSERAMADLYAFCRELTGLPEGQKMIISGWHISHIHTDHLVGFSRFLTKYSHEFDLKNIIYNTDQVEAGSDQEICLNQVAQSFPNARYYKPHTGERFTIAGVTFDVLYTAEDWYKPNSSNKLIVRDSACLNYSNDNNASMALRMTFDGKTALWLGDLEKADADLMGMYPAANIKSDILQLPHHLLDDHTTLVKTVLPSISFANMSWQASQTRGKVFNYMIKIADYAGDIYYAGNETVGYCAAEGVFYRKDQLELEYGNWGLKTYDIRNANPVTSETVKASEQFYRYSRAKELKSGLNTYAIVDHKTDWVLSYDAINGGASRALPAHYIKDTFYFAASQRRFVNWQIQYGSIGTNDNVVIPNYGNYLGVTINKGTGDYWGTTPNKNKLYLGYNDTFAASGMYSSWSGMSNQLETGSKAIWIDKMAAGTYLMYRYDNGTYYPLYRDGDVLADNGWGTAKLTYSQARSKCAYLKTRLYMYEATPSDMMIQWTGHSDYYVYPGVPQNEIISHIVSDLRVNFTLPAFGTKGEIFYDASLTKEPGTYRLEFTKTLTPNTVGNYTAKIRYINPNGTIQDLGQVTVHVEPRDLLEDGGAELFFGFGDTTADKLRYRTEPQYNYFNFDSEKRWTMSVYDNDAKKNVASSLNVDPNEGTMEIVIEDKAVNRKIVNLDLFAGSQFPLKYDPQHAEVIQVRFKLNNIKAYTDKNPYMRLWYFGTDEVRHFDEAYYFGKNFVSDGEYMTVTLDLYDQAEVNANMSTSGGPTMRFCDMDEISSIRLCFYYFLVNDTSKNGSIVIDHIYIGPKENVRTEDSSLFFDFTNTVADQIRYKTKPYANINFDLGTWCGSARTAMPVINGTSGTMSLTMLPDAAKSSIYVQSSSALQQNMKLQFNPSKAEYAQYRIKLENFTTYATPVAGLYYYQEETAPNGAGIKLASPSKSTIATADLTSGQYIVITQPVTDEFRQCANISAIRVDLSGITSLSNTQLGKVTFDYIYVGSKADLPMPVYTVKFVDAGGNTLATQLVNKGENASYTGATPTMAYDDTNHYTFKGWDKALTNISGDTVITAQFTPEAHSYTNGKCICGQVEIKEPIEDPELNLNHTLNLASDITLNYAILMNKLEGFDMDTVRVEVKVPVYEGNTLVGENTVTLEPELRGNFYYFPLNGLTAVQMNDSISAVLHGTKEGQDYYSPTDTYSIATYAYSQLDKITVADSLKALCAELLRYGTKAQIFKSYRTDSLADANMTQVHKAYLSDIEAVTFGNTNRVLDDLDNAPITWAGKALNLESKVALKFVFNPGNYTGTLSDLTLRISYRDVTGSTKTLTLADPELYNEAMGVYAFTLDTLLAAELRAVVSAQIYVGNTPVSATLQYSPDTYGNGKTGTLLDLCKALFAYSDQAKVYFTTLN